MDPQLIESLLYQEESEALDFKLGQYSFERATDEQKSELLKDVLAFANAWRQTDAYILIGVREVRGGRSVVHGIDAKNHLLNRNLQQFVHSKTNRPVDFCYAPVQFEGVQIGVLTIPLQERPLYLTENYGGLKAEVVYIRRKDTTGTATPEEVARMGAAAVLKGAQPVLGMEFADLTEHKKLGTAVTVESRLVRTPRRNRIPLYGPAPETAFGISIPRIDMQNRNYYRDLAIYIQERSLLYALGIAVTNASGTVAEEVWVTLDLDSAAGLVVHGESGLPAEPSPLNMPDIRPANFPGRPHLQVGRYGDKYEVRVPIGTVQPGTTQWSPESFYIGAPDPITVVPRIQISASNLRAPVTLSGEIRIAVTPVQMSVVDITSLASRQVDQAE